MKLYATPLSHFSRKVRILLDLYKIPYEFTDIGNVASSDTVAFASNPLMKVPVLLDGEAWLIESDHIASYLVNKTDSEDRYSVLTKDISQLNMRALMNGIMTEEVKILLARRTGVPTDQYPFFDKALKSIKDGFSWLEQNHSRFNSANPKYLDFHLVCLWDHIAYYDLVPLNYSRLSEHVSRVSENPIVMQTAPQILKPKG